MTSSEVLGVFTVPASHASLAGHFPGNPLVPGVVTLRHALDLLAEALPNERITGASKIKFMHPLRAEQQVKVEMKTLKASLHLRCLLSEDNTQVLDARLQSEQVSGQGAV